MTGLKLRIFPVPPQPARSAPRIAAVPFPIPDRHPLAQAFFGLRPLMHA
jgi:hypothetical protein